jgi:hypothetical protein
VSAGEIDKNHKSIENSDSHLSLTTVARFTGYDNVANVSRADARGFMLLPSSTVKNVSA